MEPGIRFPEALQAAKDIRTLFFAGYMSKEAPAPEHEGQNEIGNGESVMVLQGSWAPDEIMKETDSQIQWGFFRGLPRQREKTEQKV